MSWLHRLALFAGIHHSINAISRLIRGVSGYAFALFFARPPGVYLLAGASVVPGSSGKLPMAWLPIERMRALDLRAVVHAGAFGQAMSPVGTGLVRGFVSLYGGNAPTEWSGAQ